MPLPTLDELRAQLGLRVCDACVEPHRTVVKSCKHCGTEFESEKHWNKLYCTWKCSQRAHAHRARERELQLRMSLDYNPNFRLDDNNTDIPTL
jgi:hypothetical protein